MRSGGECDIMSAAIRPALLWQTLPGDIHQRLRRCLEKAASGSSCDGQRIIFFRADDVGVPGRAFDKLVNLFRSHRVPLTMAVVPAWLTRLRWQRMCDWCKDDPDLWCWVQHGWRHFDHEIHGKSYEFGPSRSLSQKRRDLYLGFERLRAIMGEDFLPVFSPPWNRCDQATLSVLRDRGYKAISRSLNARPPTPPTLADYAVSVDLHTRKERDYRSAWQSLFVELGDSLSRGFCGIMIHHQRMNAAAFDFLDSLLSALKLWNCARLVHLGHLIEERGGGCG